MRSWRSVVFLFSLALLLFRTPASANNVTITNVSLAPLGGGLAQIEFDLSWENSWRDSTNFDACWLFVKYSLDGGARWRHVTLATSGTNPASFSPGTNTDLQVVVPADKKGAFIQRTTNGEGTSASDDVRLVWNFATDGVSSNAQAIVKVFGLEMVYIPVGPFYVGANTNNTGGYVSALAVTLIDSSNVTLTNTSGSGTIADPYIGASGCGRAGGVTGTFSNSYPNGYNAYYIMKYEMSEGQYVDFLNTLTLLQATSRYPDSAGVNRHTVNGYLTAMGGSFTSAAPERATAFFYFYECWMDAAAVVDWAALRPATEMEFEKAARGPDIPIDLAYAWGTTNDPVIYIAVTNDGTALEGPKTNNIANANVNACTPDGPIRSGAFATNGSDRIKAGAGYYGVMELSGNVIDRVVSSGASGRTGAAQWPSYTGVHGDGEVSMSGMADTAGWPLIGDYYTGRAGGWNAGNDDVRVKARRTQTYMYQGGYGGVRAARTAP